MLKTEINTGIKECFIWGTVVSSVFGEVKQIDQRDKISTLCFDDSPRAGGGYRLHIDMKGNLSTIDLKSKARLTSWLISQRLAGDSHPYITTQILEEIENSPRMEVWDRADLLLRWFGKKFSDIGSNIPIHHSILLEALAWSESTTEGELQFFLNYLMKGGYLDPAGAVKEKVQLDVILKYVSNFYITMDGYRYLAKLEQRGSASRQAFVAMWFDGSMQQAYDQAIKPGIVAAGYTPLRIDKKEHNNKIDDEIIAEIKKSRFLIADFTHGEAGVRGGVYYEAGFAHGLNMPVIFTCRADAVEHVHFDTRQYNHLTWEEGQWDELRKAITNRIQATIDENHPKAASA